MIDRRRLDPSSTRLLSIAIVAVTCFSGACFLRPGPEEPTPTDAEPSTAESEAAPSDDYVELEAAYRDLQERATRAELSLLERDAQIRELEQRLDEQQRLLDATINEVVRAKAKLRGVESKAEAASEIAEAEIALKALHELPLGAEAPEYRKSMELLERSGEEFERQNYGGSIYLTSQAKALIRQAQVRLRERESLESVDGEMAFGSPLPLQVTRNSNVRDGPGLEFRVLTTLERGTRVIGYSHIGSWVRVKLEDGSSGWIHQKLVSGR